MFWLASSLAAMQSTSVSRIAEVAREIAGICQRADEISAQRLGGKEKKTHDPALAYLDTWMLVLGLARDTKATIPTSRRGIDKDRRIGTSVIQTTSKSLGDGAVIPLEVANREMSRALWRRECMKNGVCSFRPRARFLLPGANMTCHRRFIMSQHALMMTEEAIGSAGKNGLVSFSLRTT